MQHQEETILELMQMGFEREEVKQSLTAAYFNKERAVDYLLNVILLGYSSKSTQRSCPTQPTSSPWIIKPTSSRPWPTTSWSNRNNSRTNDSDPTTDLLTSI